MCFVGCLVGFVLHQTVIKLAPTEGEPTTEDPTSGLRLPRPGFENVADVATSSAADATAASYKVNMVTVTGV